jgi:hypothetical protein
MVRIYDPAQLSHPWLREFAIGAAWIATLAESANDLEDLLIDVPLEDRVLPDYSTSWPWDFDSFVAALSVMNHAREAAEQGPEELVATWLGEDRENWPVLCLTLVDQWQGHPASGRRRPQRGAAPSEPSLPRHMRNTIHAVAAPPHEFRQSPGSGSG